MTLPPKEYQVDNVTPIPEDPAAENDVIGACLLGGSDTVAKVRALISASDFVRWQPKLAFEALADLQARGEKIDMGTVRSQVDRLVERKDEWRTYQSALLSPYLVECMGNVPTSSNAEAYAKSVRTMALRRRALAAANEIARLALVGRETDEMFLGAVSAQMQDMLTDGSSSSIKTAMELATTHNDLLLRREANDPSVLGLKTGFETLDKQVAYFSGELWFVAARPSVGKTAFLKDMQWNLSGEEGIPSLFVSVEQPERQLMDRNIASLAKVDSWRVQKGQASAAEWGSIHQALSDFSSKPIYMLDDTMMTTAKLDAAVRLAVAKWGVKVVFLDYVQLMADVYGNNDYERISYISRRLAQIARSTNITMVAACQLSRQSGDPAEVPKLDHLRGSGSLEQDASVVLALSRHPDKTLLTVLKNRNGKNDGIFEFYYDAAFLKFNPVIRVAPPSPYAIQVAPPVPLRPYRDDELGGRLEEELEKAKAAVDRSMPSN